MVEPTHLYKFRPLATDFHWRCLKEILIDSKLYFPSPSTFNDPFDCAPVAVIRGTNLQIRMSLMRLSLRREPHLSRAERRRRVAGWPKDRATLERMTRSSLRETVNLLGVLSLSADCDKVLMWSHYADSHGGCCLRFKISAHDPYFARAFPVRYTKDRPEVDLLKDSYDDRLDKSLLIKADFWEYEREYRIFEHDGPPGAYSFPAHLLDGIVLGERIAPDQKAAVLSLVQQRTVATEVLQAGIDPKMFRIAISPVPA